MKKLTALVLFAMACCAITGCEQAPQKPKLNCNECKEKHKCCPNPCECPVTGCCEQKEDK